MPGFLQGLAPLLGKLNLEDKKTTPFSSSEFGRLHHFFLLLCKYILDIYHFRRIQSCIKESASKYVRNHTTLEYQLAVTGVGAAWKALPSALPQPHQMFCFAFPPDFFNSSCLQDLLYSSRHSVIQRLLTRLTLCGHSTCPSKSEEEPSPHFHS